MNPTAALDHSALTALYRADPFFTGLYIEASRGTGRILVPSLAALAAEHRVPRACKHTTGLRSSEGVEFTAGHAIDAMAWPDAEWPAVHAAAIAWNAACGGKPATVLSLVPDLYATTGIVPLDPTA